MNRTRFFSFFLICFALLLSTALVSPAVFASDVPDAPELSVTQLAGRFSLSWSTPYNGGSAITGYKYKYYLSSEADQDHQWINIPDPSDSEETTPYLDTYGEEYTFRLVAVNSNGDSKEAVLHKTLLHQNHIDVARVRDRVEQTTFSATLQEAESADELKSFLKAQIALIDANVSATVNVTSFEAAQLTQVGSFQFTVSLALGNPGEATYASTITSPLKGVISSSGKLSTPKISIATSPEGGLAYQITTTGTAAQAEAIQSFKISIYDTVNDQAVVTDYNINAAEKSGVINLSAGLKGETNYRAAVKACSADSLKYLDSDLSDLSVAARAGRIPITVRPSVTEKYYGDTEPIFGYEIVKGPDPLPTGVDLKLTFTRAEGTDVGTYSFSYQQTDTNYQLTLEEAVFEILPRPLTIQAADREVIYEKGSTFLLQEIGEVDGLVAGDEITTLDFNPSDARGEVGEFEISAYRAVITSGGKDVTKNYDITFAPGKLIIRPVGYAPESEAGGFQLWILFVILACVLLLAAGVVLFFVLKRRRDDPDPDPDAESDVPPEADSEETADADANDEENSSAEPDAYEEYLEIIDLEDVEKEAAEELAAEAQAARAEETEQLLEEAEQLLLDPDATQATIEEIEDAQAKAENEE